MLKKLCLLLCYGALSSVSNVRAISPGYISSTYALGSQAEHTLRGHGGLSSVSKQAKSVDSPYATVRKTDIRVTNDGLYTQQPIGHITYAHQGLSYPSSSIQSFPAPATIHGYHTPTAIHSYQAPATIHGYQSSSGIHSYATPTAFHGYHVPSGSFSYGRKGYNPTTLAHGYAVAPSSSVAHGYPAIGYSNGAFSAAPVTTVTKSAPIQGTLGIAYSPSNSVSTSTFTGYGIHYGY